MSETPPDVADPSTIMRNTGKLQPRDALPYAIPNKNVPQTPKPPGIWRINRGSLSNKRVNHDNNPRIIREPPIIGVIYDMLYARLLISSDGIMPINTYTIINPNTIKNPKKTSLIKLRSLLPNRIARYVGSRGIAQGLRTARAPAVKAMLI